MFYTTSRNNYEYITDFRREYEEFWTFEYIAEHDFINTLRPFTNINEPKRKEQHHGYHL